MHEFYEYKLMEELFPINRSITGDGFRESLQIIKRELPQLRINEVPTGTACFDWEIPKEWNIKEAYIIDPSGKKIVDFKDNNLHVMGYSKPVDTKLSLDTLSKHLHSLPDKPRAIPYVTSYYAENWGFCIPHELRESLVEGEYHVKIDSKLIHGSLTYGELLLPGNSEKEIFFSSYLCHPSMANNELSGPVVLTSLAKKIMESKNRNFSFRIIFVPETIGAIAYLSLNLQAMQKNIIAGFNLSCVGDDGPFSIVKSRTGDTLADQMLEHVLKWTQKNNKIYSFLERGSDERQYCSPNIDLPVVTFCRSKFGEFDEYHTSLDNLSYVKPSALVQSTETLLLLVKCLENNFKLRASTFGEPQLGKRGLYPNISKFGSADGLKNMLNLIAFADGRSLLEISEYINIPVWKLLTDLHVLEKNNLIECKLP
ncbi:DUF4910 domain-containing protein [Candidatus Puniceispirillum sp.]|nr:DUF4910 domain-containing protein [Candidatus Puniceispirillum sp.]